VLTGIGRGASVLDPSEGGESGGWLVVVDEPLAVGLGVAVDHEPTLTVGPSRVVLGPFEGTASNVTNQLPAGSRDEAWYVPLNVVPATSDIGRLPRATFTVSDAGLLPT
jgi:hypothetical protein